MNPEIATLPEVPKKGEFTDVSGAPGVCKMFEVL